MGVKRTAGRNRATLLGAVTRLLLVAWCGAPAGAEALTWSNGAPIDSHGRPIERGQHLNAVACPTATQCTAVDRHGNAVTFDPKAPRASRASIDAYGLNGVACPTRNICVAVDRHGRAVVGEPGYAWKISRLSTGAALEAVTCTSSAECVAVDSGGDMYVAR
jgi:hypothetical protein